MKILFIIALGFLLSINNYSAPCEANFIYTINLNEVSFTDISSDSTSIMGSWVWNFGDSTISLEQNPVHTFTEVGKYNVCLTSTALDSNCSDLYCDSITILSLNSCNANFTYSFNKTITYPATDKGYLYNFNDSSLGNNLKYTWKFTDGTIINAKDTSFLFDSIGNYSVTLLINDSLSSCVDSISKEINVTDTSTTKADFSYSFLSDSTIEFYSLSIGNISNYQWNFGDGLSSVLQDDVHTYSDTGTYNTCLKIFTLNEQIDSICKNIKVVNYLSINGRVTEDSNPSDGIIYLLNSENDSLAAPLKSAPIIYGSFLFDSVVQGSYKILAESNNNSYLNTYLGNTSFWSEAYTIELKGNAGGIDIELIGASSINTKKTSNFKFINPVHNYLRAFIYENESVIISITTLNQIVLHSEKYFNQQEISIDISNLPGGIYIITAEYENHYESHILVKE
jgi:PKD repeat protein